ncbi:hypothetical protein EDE08_105259 [Bradyrhizobium sp. R2.2-H]|nr:hypothetical protein EDE10_105259 [Bradyrhizobium sp. Y-H1]TCU74520.1 hypothetical protein EDE08_105259 [Bradyrhizobium sp. R2.2-H]
MPCSPGSRVPSGLPRPANWRCRLPGWARAHLRGQLDRSNDGQNHTVLPYAAHPASPKRLRRTSAPLVRTKPRAHRDYPPCPRHLVPTLPRPPQPGPRFERLANRPSPSGRAVSIYAAIPNFGKVEYFRTEGLTGWRGVLPDGLTQRRPCATAKIDIPFHGQTKAPPRIRTDEIVMLGNLKEDGKYAPHRLHGCSEGEISAAVANIENRPLQSEAIADLIEELDKLLRSIKSLIVSAFDGIGYACPIDLRTARGICALKQTEDIARVSGLNQAAAVKIGS